jgi:hypothetical protein
MDSSNNFFLLKHVDGDIFGPVSLGQLKEWAAAAMISPLDKISTDQKQWLKAPMLADLGMDFLVKLSDDSFYGPTTLGALREFLDADEISRETMILNACDGTTCQISDLSLPESPQGGSDNPPPTSLREGLQQKVKEMETTILEQRRYIARLEEAYGRLEAELSKLSTQ